MFIVTKFHATHLAADPSSRCKSKKHQADGPAYGPVVRQQDAGGITTTTLLPTQVLPAVFGSYGGWVWIPDFRLTTKLRN